MRNTSVDPHDRASASFALGTAVRRRRKDLQLRQDELADLAGCSTRFVHALETGKPSVQLDKVLGVLHVVGLHLELHRGAQPDVVDATAPPAGSR